MTAPVEVDARGMRCPWPVLRAARAMRDADSVVVLADDPLAAAELAGLASQHGWRYAASESDKGPSFRLCK